MAHKSPEKPVSEDELVKQSYALGFGVGRKKSLEFSAITQRNELIKSASDERIRTRIHDAYIEGKKEGRKKRTAELLTITGSEVLDEPPKTPKIETKPPLEVSLDRIQPDIRVTPVEPPTHVIRREQAIQRQLSCEAYIVRGLLKIILHTMGHDRAETIAYETGMQAGIRAGSKLRTGAYQPTEAIETLLHDAQCYDVEILGFEGKGKNVKVMVRFNRCVIRDIHGEEYTDQAPLCALTRGYVEGALSTMTNLKVVELVAGSAVDPSVCTGIIEFSPLRSKK